MYDRKKAEKAFYKFMKSQGGELLNKFLYNHCVCHHMNIPKVSDRKYAFKAVLDDCFRRAFGDSFIVSHSDVTNIIGGGSSAFNWADTPEGGDFWYKLHEKWYYHVNKIGESLKV